MTEEKKEIAAKQLMKKASESGKPLSHDEAVAVAETMTPEEIEQLCDEWLEKDGR
jgi:hypothetical protein